MLSYYDGILKLNWYGRLLSVSRVGEEGGGRAEQHSPPGLGPHRTPRVAADGGWRTSRTQR